MSRLIRLPQEDITRLCGDFEKHLRSGFSPSGSIDFHRKLPELTARTTLSFTREAWEKMLALVGQWDSEVAWHGLSERDGDGYLVSDILVYPQEVTGATVTTDQARYETWLMSLPDEVFGRVRMQGHSHVAMPVSPSSVDEALYRGICERMSGDMFYIFLILNKKGERHCEIVDFQKNTVFFTPDITVRVLPGEPLRLDTESLTEEEAVAAGAFLAEYRAKKTAGEFAENSRASVTRKPLTISRETLRETGGALTYPPGGIECEAFSPRPVRAVPARQRKWW